MIYTDFDLDPVPCTSDPAVPLIVLLQLTSHAILHPPMHLQQTISHCSVAFQFAIQIDSIRFVMRIDSNRFVLLKNRPIDSLVVMQFLH